MGDGTCEKWRESGDDLCLRSWYSLLDPHDPVNISYQGMLASYFCSLSGVWRLLSETKDEPTRREDTGFSGWTASVLPSSQFTISGCKKTSRVNMDTLKLPVPAAGDTCTFRVSFEDSGEQCGKDATSNTIKPLSGWTASSLDENEVW